MTPRVRVAAEGAAEGTKKAWETVAKAATRKAATRMMEIVLAREGSVL
jgi:hypothetical protein